MVRVSIPGCRKEGICCGLCSLEVSSLLLGASDYYGYQQTLRNVLQNLVEAGRLMLCVVELNEFDIDYVRKKAIKA